jgi:hypothetical protein
MYDLLLLDDLRSLVPPPRAADHSATTGAAARATAGACTSTSVVPASAASARALSELMAPGSLVAAHSTRARWCWLRITLGRSPLYALAWKRWCRVAEPPRAPSNTRSWGNIAARPGFVAPRADQGGRDGVWGVGCAGVHLASCQRYGLFAWPTRVTISQSVHSSAHIMHT